MSSLRINMLIGILALTLCAGFALAGSLKLQEETSDKRGCIASAYQATRYGHDLETNLKACENI